VTPLARPSIQAFHECMSPGAQPTTRRALASKVAVIPAPDRPVQAFGRWVAASVAPGAAVLNIGGGCNASGSFPLVRRRAGRLVAVDPSGRIHRDSAADERHQLTLEQYAADHEAEFDVAFAVFVLEHVAAPASFTDAAARVLRPGGSFLALTLNRWHYFGLATWAASRLHLEEPVLHLVRDRPTVEAYHVHTEYRLNSIRCVERHLRVAGFSAVELRMWDLPSMYEPYLPGPLRGFAGRWSSFAYRTGRPELMGHLTFRATR
jgi:SAM-dependent methyltransferase